MKTKVARGNTRKLIRILGEIQSLIGEAKNRHANDRDPHGFEKGQDALMQAFNLCVKARSDYDPVED